MANQDQKFEEFEEELENIKIVSAHGDRSMYSKNAPSIYESSERLEETSKMVLPQLATNPNTLNTQARALKRVRKRVSSLQPVRHSKGFAGVIRNHSSIDRHTKRKPTDQIQIIAQNKTNRIKKDKSLKTFLDKSIQSIYSDEDQFFKSQSNLALKNYDRHLQKQILNYKKINATTQQWLKKITQR